MPSMQPFNVVTVRIPTTGSRWTVAFMMESAVPTVSPVSSTTTASFEILSRQTKEAKGEKDAEEFIAHCRAVVAHADSASTARP